MSQVSPVQVPLVRHSIVLPCAGSGASLLPAALHRMVGGSAPPFFNGGGAAAQGRALGGSAAMPPLHPGKVAGGAAQDRSRASARRVELGKQAIASKMAEASRAREVVSTAEASVAVGADIGDSTVQLPTSTSTSLHDLPAAIRN